MKVIELANIFLYLSILFRYGQAISATEMAEIKKAIFEDDKMKGLDRQLNDNIMTTGELVTALQHQATLMNTTLNDYNELKAAQLAQNQLHEKETKALKLQYHTLEMYSKLTLPETCTELKKTGLNESVTAMINPAGLEQMFSPMEVRCDLPEDKTYLGKETKIEVVNCETLGCFKESLDYHTSNEQIEALISSSMSCRQVIKLECILAPIIDLVSIALLTLSRGDGMSKVLIGID